MQILLHSLMLPITHVIRACIHLSSYWPGSAYADCKCICHSIVDSFVCDDVFVERHWLLWDLCWFAWRGALKQALSCWVAVCKSLHGWPHKRPHMITWSFFTHGFYSRVHLLNSHHGWHCLPCLHAWGHVRRVSKFDIAKCVLELQIWECCWWSSFAIKGVHLCIDLFLFCCLKEPQSWRYITGTSKLWRWIMQPSADVIMI